MASRRVLLAVAALTLLGFALRLARYQQTVLGDETSTLYIVDGRSLSDVLDLVSSDAEISPPLYFILAWLTTKLGSNPELVRLPSLIAGTISIPLVYLLGARAMNRRAGLIAAAVMTLTPFMIFYSADGRGYAVAIAFLLASTLAMLAAARTGRTAWWVAYGAFTLAAMYTHYTAAFVLIAQLGWLMWAHPEARKAALIANVGAAFLYLPWVPGLLDDSASPTIDILSALQGDGFGVKRQAVEVWIAGYPFQQPESVPGMLAAVLGTAGLLTAVVAASVRRFRLRAAATAAGRAVPLLPKGAILVIAIAVSTPVFELLILALTGNDLLGARNLVTSSAGLALLFGGVLAAAGPIWGMVCTALVIACFGIAAGRSLGTEAKLVDFESAAHYIDAEAGPDDVVLDLRSPRVTPAPLTSLDAYLPQTRPEYRVLLPKGEPPFLPITPIPPTVPLLRRAVAAAEGKRLFVVAADSDVERSGEEAIALLVPPFVDGKGPTVRYPLPKGSRIVAERHWDGLGDVNVVVIETGD